MPCESSRTSAVARSAVLERLREERLRVAPVLVERLLRTLERDDRVHEPLLGAVVQVPDDVSARVIACDEQPGARRGQLIAAVRVGDRGTQQFGEAGQPLLGVVGRWLAICPDRGQHAPCAAVDNDGGRRPTDRTPARRATSPIRPVAAATSSRRAVPPVRRTVDVTFVPPSGKRSPIRT